MQNFSEYSQWLARQNGEMGEGSPNNLVHQNNTLGSNIPQVSQQPTQTWSNYIIGPPDALRSINNLQEGSQGVPNVTGYTTNTYGTYTASSYTPGYTSPPVQENLKKSALKAGNKYVSKVQRTAFDQLPTDEMSERKNYQSKITQLVVAPSAVQSPRFMQEETMHMITPGSVIKPPVTKQVTLSPGLTRVDDGKGVSFLPEQPVKTQASRLTFMSNKSVKQSLGNLSTADPCLAKYFPYCFGGRECLSQKSCCSCWQSVCADCGKFCQCGPQSCLGNFCNCNSTFWTRCCNFRSECLGICFGCACCSFCCHDNKFCNMECCQKSAALKVCCQPNCACFDALCQVECCCRCCYEKQHSNGCCSTYFGQQCQCLQNCLRGNCNFLQFCCRKKLTCCRPLCQQKCIEISCCECQCCDAGLCLWCRQKCCLICC